MTIDIELKDAWIYITMPFISGFVGYITNVIALKMTFYPLEFWGIPLKRFKDQPIGLFGWQGIIPCKAGKIATIGTRLMTQQLINIQELMGKLDPAMLAHVLEPGMLVMVSSLFERLEAAGLLPEWGRLPSEVRYALVLKVLEDSPPFLAGLMADVTTNIEEVFDLEEMTVGAFVRDKGLLNRVFLTCGASELTFIERSGFYFGFLFGCCQTLVWVFYQGQWLLPTCGFLVGYLTNFLALKVIFRPIDPVRCCGVTLHGLFLKRQHQVAAVYADLMSREVLYAGAMWRSILFGPKSERFRALVRAHSAAFVARTAGRLLPLVRRRLGGQEGLARLQAEVAAHILAEMPKHIHHAHAYTEKTLDVAATLREAMRAISSRQFEGVMRPAFQEDELKLILVGAVLGGAVGVFQLFVLFGLASSSSSQ